VYGHGSHGSRGAAASALATGRWPLGSPPIMGRTCMPELRGGGGGRCGGWGGRAPPPPAGAPPGGGGGGGGGGALCGAASGRTVSHALTRSINRHTRAARRAGW
jgi:hypothetical protein